jgi:hypothetical protein
MRNCGFNFLFILASSLLCLSYAEEACTNKTYPLVIGSASSSGGTHIEHIEYHDETDSLAVAGYTFNTNLRGYSQCCSSPILLMY